MTREEATRIIETVFQDEYVYKYYDSITHQALDMAIEALSADTVEIKPIEIKGDFRIDDCIYCSPKIVGNVEVVVRCKDCKHWQKTNIETIDGEPTYDCPFCGEWADANGFCSFGERREP